MLWGGRLERREEKRGGGRCCCCFLQVVSSCGHFPGGEGLEPSLCWHPPCAWASWGPTWMARPPWASARLMGAEREGTCSPQRVCTHTCCSSIPGLAEGSWAAVVHELGLQRGSAASCRSRIQRPLTLVWEHQGTLVAKRALGTRVINAFNFCRACSRVLSQDPSLEVLLADGVCRKKSKRRDRSSRGIDVGSKSVFGR